MRRLLTVSALLALAILTTAAGQPPGPKPADGKKAERKADAAIAAALARDPDVMMAKAKIQLAEAELAKARLAVAQKVMLLKTTIEQQKVVVEIASKQYKLVEDRAAAGGTSQSEVLEARIALQRAQAALAQAEAELKLLTSGAGLSGVVADMGNAETLAKVLEQFMKSQGPSGRDTDTARSLLALIEAHFDRQAVKGPIPDRLRAALDKPVKLGAKGEKITFEKALEVFKRDAGLDVPVRGSYPARAVADPKNPNGFQNKPIEIVSEGEELPVGAWFQLFEDNAVFEQRGGAAKRFRFYVRDYGLLITSSDAAPPDAPALTEFWKQKPPAPKDVKDEAKPK
jgi:hypothetical protein